MARPKTILWVDDEVEGLAAHRRFLEAQGFTIASAAHGDDALALLRRQSYSIVLLDEQMPGRRGLELIGEIRAIDAGMPVVMVTQSEDEGTLREAIGVEVDVGAEFLVPVLKAEGRALFVVVDCLRLDQWEVLRDLVTPLFDVEESHYYSILPTATPFSRNAIFSGMFPMEIAARHPGWWGQPSDEESLNAHEAELLAEQLGELIGRPVAVRYEKLFSSGEGDLVRRLPAHLAQDGVTALVFNFVDQLTHGRSESAILYEVARDEAALRSLTRTWFERSPVLAALREAERRGVTVLLTTDHGRAHV